MDGNRLSRGLGWLSVGLGLTELTFSEQLCGLLAVRRRAGLVRALGVREVLTGVGLLTQRNPRPWMWGRVVGDAADLSLLGATPRRPGAASAWRFAVTLAVAGVTLMDLLAVRKLHAKRGSDVIGMELSGAPAESWRGSGLAEDVGVRSRGAEGEASDAEREQRMRDAREQLGLPAPGSPG